MNTVEVQGTRYELASLIERWLGQFLDGVIYVAILIVPGFLLSFAAGPTISTVIGLVAAIMYLLFQDGLENGQSWGKRVVKTRVIDALLGGNPTRPVDFQFVDNERVMMSSSRVLHVVNLR